VSYSNLRIAQNKVTVTTQAGSATINVKGRHYVRLYEELWRGVKATPGTLSYSDQ